MLRGRYHDGETATEHLVEVSPKHDGLEITGASVRAFWRRQEIVVRERRGDDWRLGVEAAPDARLVLSKSAEVDAALRDLGVGKGDALKGWVLVGGLFGVAATLALLMFVAIPLAAEPLARMTPPHVERQFGDNITAQVRVIMRACPGPRGDAARAAIKPLTDRLIAAAAPEFPVSVDFVRASAPNAFALPGGQVMVTSGLLETLDSPDELAGVLAHEIGHVKARDGMVAMYRNAGLGILLEVVTGGSGVAQQVVTLGGQLAEMRYTRRQEERADETAITMLRAAGHDPAGLADAFAALKGEVGAKREKDPVASRINIPEWFASHPDLDRRIARARAAATPATATTLTPESWAIVRAACTG